MAEQRRLRRQLEASSARAAAHRRGHHGGHHRLPALRIALGRPRLPVDAARAARRGARLEPPDHRFRGGGGVLSARRLLHLHAAGGMVARLPGTDRWKPTARCRIPGRRSTRRRKAIPTRRRTRATWASPCAGGPGTAGCCCSNVTARRRPRRRRGRISTANCSKTPPPSSAWRWRTTSFPPSPPSGRAT